jgi:hypothetical protein
MGTTIKSRLIEFLAYLGVGQNAFEKKVGISNGYINNVKDSIGSKIIYKISSVYPFLNTEWLLTGKGEMLTNHQTSDNTNNNGIVGNNVYGGGINDAVVIQGLMAALNKRDEQIDKLLLIIENLKNQ